LTGSQEIGIAIGISSCPSGICEAPDACLGAIVYSGPFKPAYHENKKSPFQTFELIIPSSMERGMAQLNVAHASLVGVCDKFFDKPFYFQGYMLILVVIKASPYFFWEALNETIFVH
jgi:hypothetical protein